MSYLDTRELQERLDELEAALDVDAEPGALDDLDLTRADALEERDELQALADEISDWQYGETLIPEDEFKAYAQELAEEIGTLPKDIGWPLYHIDWDAAADALAQDYTEVSYQGTTYLVRAS